MELFPCTLTMHYLQFISCLLNCFLINSFWGGQFWEELVPKCHLFWSVVSADLPLQTNFQVFSVVIGVFRPRDQVVSTFLAVWITVKQ